MKKGEVEYREREIIETKKRQLGEKKEREIDEEQLRNEKRKRINWKGWMKFR